MKTRNKILTGVATLIAGGVAAFAAVLSYQAPCPTAPPTAAGADTDTMRAITHRCYGAPGEVLALERVAKPAPATGEMLIKVRAASVNPFEWHRVTGSPYLMRMSSGIAAPEWPRVGYDFAGTVESVGAGVTRFKPGDEVFGGGGGALADYVVSKEDGAIVPKPPQMTFDEAAGLLIAGGTALEALRDYGKVAPGQKVLINGASGGVGTYAVQLAKAFGAEVTAVCSTRNVELVRGLGADHVIDYKKENFTEGPAQYDLIIDNVGNHPFGDLERVTKDNGIIVTVSGPKKNRFFGPLTRIAKQELRKSFSDQELVFFVADVGVPDLEFLANLARDGKLRTVIDRRYPLEQAGTALDYIGSGRARGKVIVTFE